MILMSATFQELPSIFFQKRTHKKDEKSTMSCGTKLIKASVVFA